MCIKTVAKKVYAITKEYAKRHTFHMIMTVAFIVFGASHIFQYTMIGTVYGLTTVNKSALTLYKEDVTKNRQIDKQFILDAIKTQGTNFTETNLKSKMELNSRLDIIDSAIKPDAKRRMLVKKIRNAITENTNTKLTIRELNNIAIAVIDYSYQYNLSIVKILAQIRQESNFNIKAVSRAGARGLMQIMPKTLEYIELKIGKKLNPFNIYDNIRAGCYYMAEQLHSFESYELALQAYNWGPDNLKKFKTGDYSSMPKETEDYVPLINKRIEMFSKYGLE